MKITIHPLSSLPKSPAGVAPDERIIRNLEASFSQLQQRDTALADCFYRRLFAGHPELRPLFPADMSQQKRKLMDTLGLVFENLRAPEIIRQKLQKLGASHVAYGARPEYYPIVCQSLVDAMAEVAGSDWTLELQADWICAMRLISDQMLEAHRSVASASSNRDQAATEHDRTPR